MEQEIIETRYPFYDADMKALITKVRSAHRGEADVDERIIDAVWAEHLDAFWERNIDASRGDVTSLAAAQSGKLTPAGRAAIRSHLDEVRDFIDETAELSDSELVARYDEICGTAEAARLMIRRAKGLQADQMAFFSRANAAADLLHWSALPVWSAEEATALSFGKDPRRVNVASLRAYTCLHGSPFRDRFMARLDQIERALRSRNVLREPLQPSQFLKWAVAHGAEPPSGLVAGIPATGGSRTNLDVRELHTLYKVLLGLAIKHYDYDPTLDDGDEQSGVFEKLVSDLDKVEATTSAPTLRKALKLAKAWAILKPQPLVTRVRRLKESASRKAGSRA